MKNPYSIRLVLAFLLFATSTAFASPQKTAHSTVDLLVEQSSLPAAGGTVTIGLSLQPDPGWHAYWINPGDAGKAARISWELPAGFEAGELAFPPPHVLPFGELVTYGYSEPLLLLAELQVPAGLAASGQLELRGQASWVVCDDKVCVPERAQVSVSMALGDGSNDALVAQRFAAARALLPAAVTWPAEFSLAGGDVAIGVKVPETAGALQEPYLYIEQKGLVGYGTQHTERTPAGLLLRMQQGARADAAQSFRAVLAWKDGSGAARSAQLEIAPVTTSLAQLVGGAASAASSDSVSTAGGAPISWLMALLLAFVGGLILNAMPCVFPILSMKALSMVESAGSDRSVARASGLLYTAGILLAFAILGGALLFLREAGAALGWGFQLQSPIFVLAMALLMVAISLNLFGVFEIGTRLMNSGQNLTEGGERKAAFFTGLLAVVVATPCTVPFMAGALGYALAKPALIALTVFLFMGLGLAFPYLVLAYIPGLGSVLPRPGPWMVSFRQILAFPMLLTALWLFWVLGRMLGVEAMSMALLAAVAFGFTLWAYGKRAGTGRSGIWVVTALVGFLAFGLTTLQVPKFKSAAAGEDQVATLGGLQLEEFSPERVMGYIDQGQPVFVYFTADWCISCKVNERVALASDAVAEHFAARGIRVVEGDWTNEDPVITEWLQRYDRIGVPLYLYFPAGSSLETAVILPQILLPGQVIAAIDQADSALNVERLAASDEPASSVEPSEPALPDAAPDWAPIQAYIDVDTVWHEKDRELRGRAETREEYQALLEAEHEEHPDITAAVAAATAILKIAPQHEKTEEAATFMIEHTRGMPEMGTHVALGADVLARYFLDREGEEWPQLLMFLDFYTDPASTEVNSVFDRVMGNSPSAQVRSTARYYRASRLGRLANAVATPNEEREPLRLEAVDLATGLSLGAEDTELIKRRRYTDDGQPIPFQTMAEAEEDLLFNLNYMTVGNQLPDVTAARLDGEQENFTAFNGQAVLLDFWATWCGPCIASLPKLRELNDELLPDQFEILSISVDEEVNTVTEFQLDRPMPWSNWHIGPKSEILKTWAVRGYPTYILVDGAGTIRARTHDLNAEFISLIKDTVCSSGTSETLSC